MLEVMHKFVTDLFLSLIMHDDSMLEESVAAEREDCEFDKAVLSAIAELALLLADNKMTHVVDLFLESII